MNPLRVAPRPHNPPPITEITPEASTAAVSGVGGVTAGPLMAFFMFFILMGLGMLVLVKLIRSLEWADSVDPETAHPTVEEGEEGQS